MKIKICNQKLYVYINDETYLWRWNDYYSFFHESITLPYRTNVHLYVLKNGTSYIGISTKGIYDTNSFHVLYKYTPGVLIEYLDVNDFFIGGMAGLGHWSEPLKVNDNIIVMKYYTGITNGGCYDFNVRYKLEGRKLKPLDKNCKITGVLKPYNSKVIEVLKPFKIYTQPGGKKVAFTTTLGEQLKPLRLCSKGKKAYILLEGNHKRRGWANIDFQYDSVI